MILGYEFNLKLIPYLQPYYTKSVARSHVIFLVLFPQISWLIVSMISKGEENI